MKRVAAAVIIEDGRLFLTRRGPGEALAGHWELPGGKIEIDETPQQCLERELMEELDMATSAGDVIAHTTYSYQHGHFELLAIDTVRESSYSLSVHDASIWVARSELAELSLAPADVELVEALRQRGIW